MSKLETQFVVQGQMEVVRQPAILRTIVGPGVALVGFGTFSACGLWHLPSQLVSLEHVGRLQRWCLDFCRAFEHLESSLGGGTCQVIGGADILGIRTDQARDTLLRRWAATLEEILAEQSVKVTSRELGGRRGRVVLVNSQSREVTIQLVGKKRRENIEWKARQPEPPSTGGGPMVQVGMGCMHVDRSPAQLTAILGSCVGIALFDPSTHVGGLAHVMMPNHPGKGNDDARYADSAVTALLAAIVAAGANQKQVRAKIVGGGNVLSHGRDGGLPNIAQQNIATAKVALATVGIPLVGEVVGGNSGRKMTLNLSNFEITVKRIAGFSAAEEA